MRRVDVDRKMRTSKTTAAGLHVDLRGDGEPLLLLHGFTGSSADWRHIFDAAPAGFQLIAPDLPGHGRSAAEEPFTFRRSAELVAGLLEELGLDRVKAIGLSGGAQVLMHLATSTPEVVESMVLVSTAPYFPEATRRLMAMLGPDGRSDEEWTAMRGRHLLGDEQIRDLWRTGHAMKDSYDDVNFTPPSLARISAGTLIVHGDRDPLYGIDLAVGMHGAIGGSHLWIVPNGGHLPIFGDDATLFTTRALPFLRGDWGGEV